MAKGEGSTIRGVISPDGGGRSFQARLETGLPMVAHTWFTLSSWRFGDGPIEHGEFVAKTLGTSEAPSGEKWEYELWPGRVVQFDARFDDAPTHQFDNGKMPWRFDDIVFDPIGETELDALANQQSTVSPPEHPWDVITSPLALLMPGAHQQFKDLVDAIGEPEHKEFRKAKAKRGVLYDHISSRTSPGLGQGRPVFVNLGHNTREGHIGAGEGGVYWRDLDVGRGKDRLRTFAEDILIPAAEQIGLAVVVDERPDIVVPDPLRREPIEVGDIGQAIPVYKLRLAKNPDREPRVELSHFQLGPLPAPLFDGAEVAVKIEDEDHANPRVVQTLIDFFELDGELLAAARTEIDRRAWKMKHKKRREFDASDTEALEEIWSELTILPSGFIEKLTLNFSVSKPTKDWPIPLKVAKGVKVTKFS